MQTAGCPSSFGAARLALVLIWPDIVNWRLISMSDILLFVMIIVTHFPLLMT